MAIVTVLLLLVLSIAPAAGQTTVPPGSEFNPRTPPTPTIPSAPEIVFPVQPPTAARPVQLFEFHPLLGLSEEYSDNFNRSVRNHEDNFRSMVSPGMNVRLDAGYLTGQATYVFSGLHDSSSDELGYFNAFAGQLSWEATPRLRLSASAGVTQNDEPGRADRLGLRLERRRFTAGNGSLSADWEIASPITASPYYRASYFNEDRGAETLTHIFGGNVATSIARINTVTLGYEYLTSETSNARGARDAFGVSGHQLTASLSRDLSERSTAGISGNYAWRTQDAKAPDAEINFTRWNGSVFANYAIPNTIAIRASVGVSQLSSDSFNGDPVVSTASSLSYWFGQAVATITVERGFSETFAEGQNQGVVKTTGASGSLVYPFTPSLGGHAGVSYHENEFTGIGGTPTATGGNSSSTRTDKVLSAGVGVSYQILRWLGSSLDYTYSRTDSSDVDGHIIENSVRLSLNFAF